MVAVWICINHMHKWLHTAWVDAVITNTYIHSALVWSNRGRERHRPHEAAYHQSQTYPQPISGDRVSIFSLSYVVPSKGLPIGRFVTWRVQTQKKSGSAEEPTP